MKAVILIHIIAGSLTLLAGIAALFAKKGSKAHRLSGRLFTRAMSLSLFASLIPALAKNNLFLFMIAVFSLFMLWSGNRALLFMRDRERRPLPADYIANGINLLVCSAGIILCAVQGIVPGMIFGALSVFFSVQEFRQYALLRTGKMTAKLWLAKHIGMMCGAYIAAVTAALINNVPAEYGIIPWLVPTVIGSPLIAYFTLRYTRSQKPLPAAALIAGMLLLPKTEASAQVYVENDSSRFRFAQLTLGAEIQHIPGNGVFPRIVVGGTHFWGHADFVLSFPVAQITSQEALSFSSGVETGAKFFPWRIEKGRPRPFIGFDWALAGITLGDNPSFARHIIAPNAGLFMDSDWGIFTAGISYNPLNNIDYPLPDGTVGSYSLPELNFRVGYRRSFETTLSAEEFHRSGRQAAVEGKLAEQGRLNNFFIGLGFSSAFILDRAEFVNNPSYRFTVNPALFPEFSAGYYHHGLDAALSLNYRSIGHTQAAYGREQVWSNRVIGLEAKKFLADYHGFVPFLGAALGYERVSYSDGEISVGEWRWNPSLVFGWDIRPNRQQAFTIRTNLRWTPQREVSGGRKNIPFSRLEFNFFELILYPGRIFGLGI